MFEHDRSSSKGLMSVREPLFIFKHEGTDSDETQRARQKMLGCAPAHKIFNLIDVKKCEGVESPRSFNNYSIAFHRSKLPNGVNVGFAFTGDNGKTQISWGELPDRFKSDKFAEK